MFPSYTTRHLKGLLRNVDLEQTEWKVIEAIKELKKKTLIKMLTHTDGS